MPQAAWGNARILDVVVPIRRGDHHCLGFREPKQHPFECTEPFGVEMLQGFDHGHRVETLDAPVAIRHRPLKQLDPSALSFRHALEPEAAGSRVQRTDGDVHADDLLELPICQEVLDQPPLPAPQIDDARGIAFLQGTGHRRQTGVRQSDKRFRPGLVVANSGNHVLVVRQTGQRIIRQIVLVLEVPTHDEIPTGVTLQPALPPGDELVHFGVADPVVLATVQHRNQHVEMGQQFRQRLAGRQGDVAVVAARAVPRLNVDFIAQWFEEFSYVVRAPARKRRDLGSERQRLADQFRPVPATPAQGTAEHARDGDAQERRRDIRPVVDVVGRHRAAPADEGDGIDIEEQCRRAALFRRLRVEDMRLAERQFEGLDPGGILVQEISQIGGRVVRGGDRQQHE